MAVSLYLGSSPAMWRCVCSDQSSACRADSHRAGHKCVAAALAGPDFDSASRADEHHGAARQSSVAKWGRTLSSHGLRVFKCSAFPLITGWSGVRHQKKEVGALPVTRPELLLRAGLICTQRGFSKAFLFCCTNSLIATGGTREGERRDHCASRSNAQWRVYLKKASSNRTGG